MNCFAASSSVTVNEATDITPIGQPFIKQNLKSMGPFPKDKGNRCFQSSWGEKFDWLEYSQQQDAVFCYPCRQFNQLPKSETTYVNVGYSNWKHALDDRGMCRHEKSSSHLSAVLAWNEKQSRDELNTGIQTLITKSTLEKRQYYVSSIIDVIKFLVENELSFRGNWEKEMKEESGKFMNLLKLLMKRDEKLKASELSMPDHVKYTSPDIQNELIEIMAHSVRRTIVADVNKSEHWTAQKTKRDVKFYLLLCDTAMVAKHLNHCWASKHVKRRMRSFLQMFR